MFLNSHANLFEFHSLKKVNLKKTTFTFLYFIKHTFILSKLIIKDKTKMWKSCAG